MFCITEVFSSKLNTLKRKINAFQPTHENNLALVNYFVLCKSKEVKCCKFKYFYFAYRLTAFQISIDIDRARSRRGKYRIIQRYSTNTFVDNNTFSSPHTAAHWPAPTAHPAALAARSPV